MAKFSIDKIELPLKVDWSISRGEAIVKENLIVTFKDDKITSLGEVAFITGSIFSCNDVIEQFENILHHFKGPINGLTDFTRRIEPLEVYPCLKNAMESAYIGYLAQVIEGHPDRVLGQKRYNGIETSFSVTHMKASQFEAYNQDHNLKRFKSLKVKVKSFDDIKLIKEVSKHHGGKLRIDANEAFTSAEEVLSFLDEVNQSDIEFLEQPLAANNYEQMRILRQKSKVQLMADETLQDGPVSDSYQEFFHGVNIKLSKCGGPIKALHQCQQARALGMKTMLGCMIETSVGISMAMNITRGFDYFDLDGFLLLQKDPYSLVSEQDGRVIFSDYH